MNDLYLQIIIIQMSIYLQYSFTILFKVFSGGDIMFPVDKIGEQERGGGMGLRIEYVAPSNVGDTLPCVGEYKNGNEEVWGHKNGSEEVL